MNNTRLRAIEDGQSGIAKKVLEMVPKAEAWSVHQIATEMKRVTGSAADLRMIEGCLHSLREAGLVRTTMSGTYTRVTPKPESAPKPKDIEEELPTTEVRKSTVLEELAGIAARFRSLANELDEAALRVEEETSTERASVEQLHQLRALLKGALG